MTPTTATDEELAQRARDGDESAVESLFERWAPRMRERVRRSLRGGVRRRVAESDVIQDAWLAAFLGLGDFEDRGEGSFGRWLQDDPDLDSLRDDPRLATLRERMRMR